MSIHRATGSGLSKATKLVTLFPRLSPPVRTHLSSYSLLCMTVTLLLLILSCLPHALPHTVSGWLLTPTWSRPCVLGQYQESCGSLRALPGQRQSQSLALALREGGQGGPCTGE